MFDADNGATEVFGTSSHSKKIFYGGPIRYWWKEGMWGSELHRDYTAFRDQIYDLLCEKTLVYAPYRAWRGPWNEVAQKVNDFALNICDAFVELSVPGVPAHGTAHERALSDRLQVPVYTIGMSRNPQDNIDLAKMVRDTIVRN